MSGPYTLSAASSEWRDSSRHAAAAAPLAAGRTKCIYIYNTMWEGPWMGLITPTPYNSRKEKRK